MKSILPTLASLRFPHFRLFWVAAFASQLGFQMQTVGITWHIYEITHSAVFLGLIGLAGFIPILIFSLLAGVTADKFSRKKVMITSQIINFISASVLATATHFGFISPTLIYVAVALNAFILTFDLPARQAVLPLMVPKQYFVNAVSLATLIRQVAIIVGPAIAGFTIELLGVRSVYLLNAFFFLVSFSTVIFLAVPPTHLKSAVRLDIASILEGIHFVRKSPIIYSTMLLDFFATFFSAATILLPIFAKDILGTGARGLGLLYAAPSIGAVITGITLASLGHIRPQGKILLAGILLYGGATIGFGLSKSFPLSLLFLTLVGAGDMLSTVIRNTIRQMLTPDYLRGRMVSINMVFFAGGPQLGELEAGVAAALIGAPASVVIGGIGTVFLTAVVALSIPKLWQYER